MFNNFAAFFRLPAKVRAAGILVSFILILIMGIVRMHMPDSYCFNWEFQRGQFSYSANRREIFENADFYIYAIK